MFVGKHVSSSFRGTCAESEDATGMPVTGIDEILSFDKALKIATELKGFPKDKMIEVAKGIIGVSRDTAFQIIETAKAYPLFYIHTFKYVSNNIHITINVYQFNTFITLSMY